MSAILGAMHSLQDRSSSGVHLASIAFAVSQRLSNHRS